jgi:hypothetical protein
MDKLIILKKNSKEELIKEIINNIDEGYIPVGNLEKIEESYGTAEGYEYTEDNFYPPPQVLINPAEFTQSMYKPIKSTLSTSGGSYKNKNKTKNKTKKNNKS